jgi:hypothetical protein
MRGKQCIARFLMLASCILPLASGKAANILITNNACLGVAATPAPDVAYKAGVDVNGNAVAPADLPGSAPAIRPPDTIKIPLQINLQNALHLNNSNLYSPDAVVGTIEYKDGQVTFNGQPVSEDAAAQIKAACQTVPKSETLSGPRSKNLLMGE